MLERLRTVEANEADSLRQLDALEGKSVAPSTAAPLRAFAREILELLESAED